jgi:hypothetical protein
MADAVLEGRENALLEVAKSASEEEEFSEVADATPAA